MRVVRTGLRRNGVSGILSLAAARYILDLIVNLGYYYFGNPCM